MSCLSLGALQSTIRHKKEAGQKPTKKLNVFPSLFISFTNGFGTPVV